MPKSKLDELLGMQISGYEVHQYWSEGDGVLMQLRLIFDGKIVTLDEIVDGMPVFPGSFSLDVKNATYSTAHKQNEDGVPDEKVTFTGMPCYFNGVEKRSGTFVVIISGKKK